ncbi:MAG TPA: hypothetical protein VJR29_02185, partial [bacterium]|nr:hypothetical protein [bacterium]
AGHRMEEWAGLRPTLDGATTAIDSLALLLQFNMAGRLSQRLFGERFRSWERELDRRSELLDASPRPSLGIGLQPLAAPAYAMGSFPTGPMMMVGSRPGGGSNRPSDPQLPKMGIRHDREGSSAPERLNRQHAERVLRELLPASLRPGSVESDAFVERLLNAFGIPGDGFDVRAFQQGYRIAQRYPERVSRLAFDFDEVTLHWAFGPRDLLSVMAQGAEAAYFHTPTRSLEHEPLLASEGQGLNRLERVWFEGVQRLLPMAFRQHIQFHPGMRALQLGLRLGQESNLMMVTVGMPGRLMRLANEDPALKMIYFGRLPMDELTIGNIRGATNIYTREDIVQALRAAQEGNIRFPNNPMIESYVETLRRHPDSGNRLKHPALALLRGKRPFDALVDDSAFALEVLSSLPGFTVFQVPSARPARTKNFTWSIDAYLARSANGYVDALADLLLQKEWQSGPVENRPAPADYPYQRFSIEIPWAKFGQGYVALGKEAKARGRTLAEGRAAVTAPLPAGAETAPLSLSESQTRAMIQRLYGEFDILLDGKVGEVSIEAANTLMFKEMASVSPENFQASLDSYFTVEEQALLPQASRPLAERSEAFYSRVASLVAVKTAVCNLLSLDVAEHAREIRFRHGRPFLSGMAAHRLNGNSMLVSLSDEGEIGIGIALIEPGPWSSGLIGIGVDLTGDRSAFGNPERHALAAAAYKAVYPALAQQREFSEERTGDVVSNPAGGYSLAGESLAAAQNLRGDARSSVALPIHGLSFQIGPATLGLVGIPAPGVKAGPGFYPRPSNFPYRMDEDGLYQLPRRGMTVAVLGDSQAFRTLDLIRKGHSVIHIDRHSDNAELTERMVKHLMLHETPAVSEIADSSVVRADWYGSANADLIEAYFPFKPGDLPPRDQPERYRSLHHFLDQAINAKLVNGGSAFIVSDVREDIQDLVQVVGNSSRLRLLEDRYNVPRSPVSGGFGPAAGNPRLHYLIYRKESSD